MLFTKTIVLTPATVETDHGGAALAVFLSENQKINVQDARNQFLIY
jgi:hypothetical protein